MIRAASLARGLTYSLLSLSCVARADCISLIKGGIAMDVGSCGVLNPEMSFDTTNQRYAFIRGLSTEEQKKFLNSYRGMIIKGKVVGSQAVRSGLTSEQGALNGEDISVFVLPGTSDQNCSAVNGKRISAMLTEACCDGGSEPPCLLSSSYTLKSIKVLGSAGSSMVSHRKEDKKSALQIEGEGYFTKKQFQKAADTFEKARSQSQLNLSGHLLLGFAYRQLDKCQKALPVLQYVEEKGAKKEFWADEEITVRKSKLLLARCYSKLNQAGYAVTTLESFLLDPQKHRSELKTALEHADFGWIHTTKEYRNFREEVYRKIGRQ